MSDYPEIAARFARETAGHEMTVLHEDGLYRHLVCADPEGGFYRFDLITWPHNLMLRGDGFSFGFSVYPTADIFEMFRGSSHGGINPGYWQEKVTAGRGDIKDWSEDLFRAWVTAEAAAHESRFPGLVEAVGQQILHSDEHNLEYRGTAEYAVASFSHEFRLRIPDEWEQSFDDFSWEFLFACHAIVWGIRRYDEVRQAVATVNEPLTPRAAQIRLAQYGERTKTWSTATCDSGAEKALYEIALTLSAEVDRLRAELRDLRRDVVEAERQKIRDGLFAQIYEIGDPWFRWRRAARKATALHDELDAHEARWTAEDADAAGRAE